jgi:hypothetical protein
VKTIRRNATKKIAALATEVMATRLHELSGGFVGVPVPVTAAFDALAKYDFAKLTDHENGKYTVHVHGNQWFYLYTAQWFQGLGRDAHSRSNVIAAPAADPAMTSVLNGMPVGTGAAELMLEWQKGWNAAARENEAAARGAIPHDCATNGCEPINCYQRYLDTDPTPRLNYSVWVEQISDYEPA